MPRIKITSKYLSMFIHFTNEFHIHRKMSLNKMKIIVFKGN
jgi:hypothetical protein